MASRTRTRQAAAGALACALLFGLAGCFSGGPTSTSSTSSDSTASTPSPSPSPSVKITAQMTIASVDVDGQHVSVSGYVNGIVEDHGACTYTATSKAAGQSVEVAGEGVSNVRTTSCGTLAEPIASFSTGAWAVRLHYVSTSTDVTSEPIEVEIP